MQLRSHQQPALTILSALILICPYEPFARSPSHQTQPLQCHRYYASLNLMSPYGDIVLSPCSRPWGHTNLHASAPLSRHIFPPISSGLSSAVFILYGAVSIVSRCLSELQALNVHAYIYCKMSCTSALSNSSIIAPTTSAKLRPS